MLPVQYPYKRLVRRIFTQGRILDVGCGFGRLLEVLPPGSIGVDHNADMIAAARARGLDATSAADFSDRFDAEVSHFDGLLCAHMIEHLAPQQAREILAGYLTKVRPGGKVLLITPQRRGYQADPTHVSYYDLMALIEFADSLSLQDVRGCSYPFPGWVGNWFTYNENAVIAKRADSETQLR